MAIAKKKVVAAKPVAKAPVAKVAAKPVVKAVAKPVAKVASKVAAKAPAAKPVAKVASKVAVKAPVAKPVAKVAPKVAPKVVAPVAKTVAKVAPKVVAAPAAKPVAKSPAKSADLKEVVFSVYSPESASVEIAGDFNSWDPTKGTMKKDKDGNWLLKLKLAKGVYQYKIVFDATSWEPDQKAPSIQVEHGQNSILNVE